MDRRTSRYTPSVPLVIAFICAVVVLALGVIGRNWWTVALSLVLLIGVALTYTGARRRQSKI